jgi:hypothetical protein
MMMMTSGLIATKRMRMILAVRTRKRNSPLRASF